MTNDREKLVSQERILKNNQGRQNCSKFGENDKQYLAEEKGFSCQEMLEQKDLVIAAKDALITELYKIIKLLEDKIENSSKNENLISKTYCEAAKITRSDENCASTENNEAKETKLNQASNNFIIIKPNKKQETKVTKKEIIKYVNSNDLKVGIQKVFDLKDGGVKILCNSRENVEKLKKEAIEKMGDSYSLKTEKKRNPRIKIIGLEENYTKEELALCIRSQNNGIAENSKIDVIVIRKMKTKYFAIVEVDQDSFKSIMDSGVILIDLSVCSVFEHIDILRCFRCTGYHHTNKNCTNQNSFCIKCGLKGHSANNCETDEKYFCCPNCFEANEKYKLHFMINHGPFNRECEIFKKKIEVERRKIEYI